ncbi:MAG: GntR family transcriptional regulator [Kineosporiaceae bacterium]|nr:GntR family transcriptional regulator [Kineosporiaceae bacterium]
MTGLAVRIDREAGTPPFEQLELQLAALIEQGTLRAGDKLPTVRRLADDLGLAANTVARAYRDLEARGLVDTRGRSGTFVAGDDVDSAARQAAHDFVTRIRTLGVDPDVALELVRRGLAR